METQYLRNWIEVDSGSIEKNYLIFRQILSSNVKLMAVVKSNAYGHDFIQYSKLMEKLGVDYLGVDSIAEAVELRKDGIQLPILILGYTLPSRFEDVAEHDVEMTVSSLEQLRKLDEIDLPKKIKIHIKIDSGMHRQGFQEKEIDQLLTVLKDTNNIEIVGVYTHFAAAKNPKKFDKTRIQFDTFNRICEKISSAGINFIKHAAATGGTLVLPESRCDMVRIGIGLMGLWPSKDTQNYFSDHIKLTPALIWKSIVSEKKKVLKGEGVGYDFTEILERDSVLAIVPIGYWHGYRRDLSSKGHVLIGGEKCRVIGRVSMDMIIVDVTNVRCDVLDEVVIIGSQGDNQITAYDIAEQLSDSWYEVITLLNPQIKRIYK